MVRIAVETTVWSSAARNMPSISPDEDREDLAVVNAPLASGAAPRAGALRSAAVVRVDWLIGSLSGRSVGPGRVGCRAGRR